MGDPGSLAHCAIIVLHHVKQLDLEIQEGRLNPYNMVCRIHAGYLGSSPKRH